MKGLKLQRFDAYCGYRSTQGAAVDDHSTQDSLPCVLLRGSRRAAVEEKPVFPLFCCSLSTAAMVALLPWVF